MKCASCDSMVNDSVQCGACKKSLGFCCANITEQGYRKLGPERRINWRCMDCKRNAPPVIQATTVLPVISGGSGGGITLESIMAELKELKDSLRSLPGLVRDVKDIKSELTDVKNACEFNSAKLEEYGSRLGEVEKVLPEFPRIQAKMDALEDEIGELKRELAAKDQWARLNNVEIKGVPLKKNENLFTIVENICKAVNFTFPKTSINYVSRVPMQNSKEKSIIVSFINRYMKEDFVASARIKRSLKAAEIGFEGSTNVYINDHLTPESKKLLTKTKSTLKAKGYMYVWVKFGKIHVRKDDMAQTFVVHREADLNKLF